MESYTLQPDHLRRLNECLRWYERNSSLIDGAVRDRRQHGGHIASGAGPIPFQLKTSLTPGGTATAYLTTPDGTIIDESTPLVVTVTDTIGDKRAVGKDDAGGGDGALGLAEVLSDGTVAIVNIHQRAKRCSAILTADAGPGASVNVDNVVPLDGGMSPVASSSTTLSATMPPAARALDDAACVIEWDETTDTWKIDGGFLHEMARQLKSTLSGDLTGATATVNTPTAMDGGQVPTSLGTIKNTRGFRGLEDDYCELKWDEDDDAWEIEWVVLKTQADVLTDWQYNGTSEDIEEKTRDFVSWFADTESDWTKIDDTEECQEAE